MPAGSDQLVAPVNYFIYIYIVISLPSYGLNNIIVKQDDMFFDDPCKIIKRFAVFRNITMHIKTKHKAGLLIFWKVAILHN